MRPLPEDAEGWLIVETRLGGAWSLAFNADARFWDSTAPFLEVGHQIDTLRDCSLAAEVKGAVGRLPAAGR